MIGNERSWKLLAGLIMFNFSIPIASAMGFSGFLSGASEGLTALYVDGITSVSFWADAGLKLLTFLVATRVLSLRLTAGAVVFAAFYQITTSPLHSITTDMVNQGVLMPEVKTLIIVIFSVAFIIGFVEVSR